MPLDASSLITTVGGDAANSYATLAEAEAYHDLNLGSEAWFAAEEGDRIRGLVKAARRLNSENWIGERVTTTQKLAWPRIGAAKPDSSGGGIGYYYGGFEAYTETEIPEPVKQAQYELALALLAGFDDGDSDAIEEFSESGGMRVKFAQPSRLSGELPAAVARLINPLLAGDLLLVRG